MAFWHELASEMNRDWFTANKARIRLALTDARIAGECAQAMDAVPDSRVIEFGSGEAGSLESLMRDKSATFANCATAADDVALIAFTSGTTREGKGTMHFHRDVMAITDCFPRYVLRPERDDIFCGSPPFAFTFG